MLATLAIALALSVLIGVSLGLLGGGGSILTLPILTYAVGMETKAAIAASLFVVGVTSAVGAIAHARAGRIQWRTGLLFGAAGMVGAFAGGRAAAYVPAQILMIVFAAMMVATAVAMLRGRRGGPAPIRRELPIGKVLGEGVVVGVVTGIVGAGGGFLVVPALVLLGGLAMEVAVGTSLVVIAMKSFAGLAGHLGHVDVDWPVTLAVTGAAVVGSIAGGALAGRIPPEILRRGFGVFVLVMAAFILGKQLGVL
jgi:uncharacterized membrane protein YfcA